MPKDTFYFQHDYNARSDKEMMKVRMKMGMRGIGLFWCIVEMLYEENGYLSRSEYERISFELQSNYDDVKMVIEEFNLFKIDENKFWSNSVLDRLNKRKLKSEKAKESISYRWNNTNVKRPKNDANTIKERKGKKNNKDFFSENSFAGSNLKGIRIDKNKNIVFFEDESFQNLGPDQIEMLNRSQLSPQSVIKNQIY
jgi:hypothetical protein